MKNINSSNYSFPLGFLLSGMPWDIHTHMHKYKDLQRIFKLIESAQAENRIRLRLHFILNFKNLAAVASAVFTSLP